MTQVSGSSHLIAATELIAREANGDQRPVNVRIYSAEPDPLSDNGDMRCRIEFTGILEPYYTYGIDSLQALGLAFASLRREFDLLEHEGWEFFHPEDDSEPMPFAFVYCGDESACPWPLDELDDELDDALDKVES
ncbi:hypothetical protein [Parendozoicomonas haliclonae]|uniref:Uncharacterized protein n=1 Tax=Parendozoicomonas haliclonae TaxID=1960125 RepID=A0A1X7AFY9_9GAMM|nr:hypothetical protein [Parendozoicomonas haliclonae]SMA37499.1 hypothetical protein EHSB41UT_00746 [Parendozoicomonas haliclonae]